jgi:hypothetical protein
MAIDNGKYSKLRKGTGINELDLKGQPFNDNKM